LGGAKPAGQLMTRFSTMATRVIESFAAGMGIMPLEAEDHSYGFEFEKRGKLSIVPSEDNDRVIVCLARQPRRSYDSTRRLLLDLAGFNSSGNEAIHAGIAPDGSFVLAIDLDVARFDLQLLDQTLSELDALHDSIT
jgi:hypothetical protein